MSRRGRFALALLASVFLHGLVLVQRLSEPQGTGGSSRLSVVLRGAPGEQGQTVLPARVVRPEPAPALTTPARSRPPDSVRGVPRPGKRSAGNEPAPETDPATPSATPPGRELAADALAGVQGLTREMDRQERRLDPTRDHMREQATPALPPGAVAMALEKRFGRRVRIREESIEPQADGSALYRLKTEVGAVCIRTFPPNVILTAPGQGLGHMLLVPMTCP